MRAAIVIERALGYAMASVLLDLAIFMALMGFSNLPHWWAIALTATFLAPAAVAWELFDALVMTRPGRKCESCWSRAE